MQHPSTPRVAAGMALWLVATCPAHAFIVSVSNGLTPAIYLRIGDGASNGNYVNGGTPANNATVNQVSVTLLGSSVGNGVSQAMTTNATQSTSNYDGYAFCSLPAQVYVGGLNRGTVLSSNTGTLSVTAPTSLTNATGDTIPFSQISWTSTGNGESGAQPFPAGTFTGGTQTLASFPANSWRESCHAFSYRNSAVVAAGTYTGRVTYTLSVP